MGSQNIMEREEVMCHIQSDGYALEEAESVDSIKDGNSATFRPTRSTPSRPHTRLQTGIVLKRRTPDDAHFHVAPKKATTGRKKSKKPVVIEQVDARIASSSTSSPNPPVTRQPSLGSVSASSRDPTSTPQTTFWHASSASDDQHEQEPRLPRSRATLPTPIPNLTKKSRGRRVPTQEVSRSPTDQKDIRLYICEVEGCGKRFHRGEHLKRHIRSIHTHEKPFPCTYPQCEKHFNRHDNLLQHLKVHREPQHREPQERPTLQKLRILSPRCLEEVQQRYESPMDEPELPVPSTPPQSNYREVLPSPYHSYSVTYSPTEPTSLITDMAVSSLRTVLPHSPTESRTHFMQPLPRQYHS